MKVKAIEVSRREYKSGAEYKIKITLCDSKE